MLSEPQFLSILLDIWYTWWLYTNYTSYQISSKNSNFHYPFGTHEVTPSNSDYGLSETRLQAPKRFNQPPRGQVTPIFLHISFSWVKKLHPEIQLPRLPGTALRVWVGWWWWSNSLLCHSQLELRLSWVKSKGRRVKDGRGGMNPVAGFCIFHLVRLK